MNELQTNPASVPVMACKHFGRCGGCQFLSVPYVEQLKNKARWVRELFAERGVQIMTPNYVADPAQAKIPPRPA